MKISLFSTLLLLTVTHALAGTRVDHQYRDQFQNNQQSCHNEESCNLKSLSILVEDYTTRIKGKDSLGTRAYLSYETKKVDQLTDFAIVQYIKGCVFHSELDDNGNILKTDGISRQFFDGYKTFKHRDWEIDSIDKDPIYNSYSDPKRRHVYYRWSKKRGNFKNDDQQVYFFKGMPPHPELYVTDRPAQAFTDNSLNELSKMSARNVSLKFKTCIYKTNDIPLETTPEDIDFARPISCLDWDSSFIYNHKLKKYESKDQIDPYCL